MKVGVTVIEVAVVQLPINAAHLTKNVTNATKLNRVAIAAAKRCSKLTWNSTITINCALNDESMHSPPEQHTAGI